MSSQRGSAASARRTRVAVARCTKRCGAQGVEYVAKTTTTTTRRCQSGQSSERFKRTAEEEEEEEEALHQPGDLAGQATGERRPQRRGGSVTKCRWAPVAMLSDSTALLRCCSASLRWSAWLSSDGVGLRESGVMINSVVNRFVRHMRTIPFYSGVTSV